MNSPPFVNDQGNPPDAPLHALIGKSDQMAKVRALVERLAPCDVTVLIRGETGTGKELAARAIHNLSRRSGGPMIYVNCAAIPDSLVESELFGSEKGAFTGSVRRQEGQVRLAQGGTLLLDEVGDMSLPAQAKILRTLETKEVQRLGGAGSEPVDVRILAATHQDLETLVADQRFRSDLFFRLNVLPITLPPLRERHEDIPLLVDHFRQEFNHRYNRRVEGVSTAGMRLLLNYDWPGNVRELRNVLEGAFVLSTSRIISAPDFRRLRTKSVQPYPLSRMARSPVLPRITVQNEPDKLLDALRRTRWNKTQAAKLLHWSRMTVYRKIAKYDLAADRERPGTPVDPDSGTIS
jgi:transcriptional regulator with PAS, ATPase and Fis domain